jgi:hypothetical protein
MKTKPRKQNMNGKRILAATVIIVSFFSLIALTLNSPSASACVISLGKKNEFNMELSPKVPLFSPSKDGYFYPGSPKITKNVEVKNVGDIPFKIFWVSITFHRDTHLAAGLQTKIVELGQSKGEKPHLLYDGTLSKLSKGVEVKGQIDIQGQKSDTLQITIWMPETAGNEFQGLRMTADIAITVCYPNPYYGGKY